MTHLLNVVYPFKDFTHKEMKILGYICKYCWDLKPWRLQYKMKISYYISHSFIKKRHKANDGTFRPDVLITESSEARNEE